MDYQLNIRNHNRIVVICCGVLQAEMEMLLKSDWPGLEICFANSMLHMRPDKLAQHLNKLVLPITAAGKKVLLVYGDCSTSMTALDNNPHVVRVAAKNCCELVLGNSEYRRFSRQGAFFLFPEWTHRWRHIFSVELGLNRENAASLMGEMHSRLVYLDTGLVAVPEDELQQCSDYCGLPWEILPISLEPLRTAVENALIRLETDRAAE